MASPITLYVVPNCGIEIEFIGDDPKTVHEDRRRSYNASQEAPYHYRITNKTDDIPLLTDNSLNLGTFTGICSPTHDVTLPRAIKKKAGVPEKASYYAAIHPPSGLANKIDWANFKVHPRDIDEELKKQNKWGIPCIFVLGGFVYFDSNYNIIAINALSLSQTEYDLQLSGPFKPKDAARKQILRMKRAHAVTAESFFELGIVGSAWIRPNEKFHHEPVVDRPYKNGGIMFICDDGTAFCYVIDRSEIDPSGDVCLFADIFNLSRYKPYSVKRMKFIDKFNIETPEERSEMRSSIHRIRHSTQKENFLDELGVDRRTFTHQACKLECDIDTIESHLDEIELRNLEYGGGILGMTPLHYACHHQPTNQPLIRLLIDKCPEAVLLKDTFGRCPLHVACASGGSMGVIEALLAADKTNETIQQPTTNLRLLPIHIAINKKSENVKDIVELLLQADPSGQTLTIKTRVGRLALHMAIEKKLPTDVIQLLLDTNVIEREEASNHKDVEIEMTFSRTLNGRKAVGTAYNGMLPLHIACWNNSSPHTIKALLDADEDNSTVDVEVGGDSWLMREKDCLDEAPSSRSITDVSKSSSFTDNTYDFEEQGDATIEGALKSNSEGPRVLPLHLAATHGSKEVVRLLLEKLKKAPRPIGAPNIIELRGLKKMTPIHIACRDTNDPVLIESLLSIDDSGVTTHMKDEWGYTPIHYACDKEDSCKKIVQMLIQAEEFYISTKRLQGEAPKRTTNQFEGRKRSPLYLAGKAGAPEDVIEILLQPEHFYLKGSDDELIGKLAKMAVKNRQIQDSIIDKLSERCYFNLLFTDIYTISCALTAFLIGTENLIDGRPGAASPILLFICVTYFVLRELIQIKSQSTQFFSDIWNYCQVASITLLFLSAKHLAEAVGNDEPAERNKLLVVTGAFLIAQLTFFLRATFLPFARFVGGLLMIFHTLVPFFIVSSLLLLAFTYGFRVQGQDECPSLSECYAWTLQGFFSGADETNDVLDVLFGVIAIVVLLNVVIAIVSEAWDNAQDRAMGLFWKFRLEFLSEARFFAVIDKKLVQGSIIGRLGNLIDQTDDLKYSDHTPWSKDPYNIVDSKKAYDKPLDFFEPVTAKIIEKTHSLQASLYWVRSDSKRKKRTAVETRILSNWVILNWLASAFFYCFLSILGLFTAGWVWPKNLRKKVLAVGIRKDDYFSTNSEKKERKNS